MRLATWGTAVLTGRASLDDAADRIQGPDDLHRVAGLPQEPADVALTLALGRLRTLGARGLRVALPAPGDPFGLPGPGPFTGAAIDAGEAVTCAGAPYGVVPEVSPLGSSGTAVRWQVHELPAHHAGGPPRGGGLQEAERELQWALREATAVLTALDVARWRPEVAEAVRALREGFEEDGLAPGTASGARRVLALGRRVRAIALLAAQDHGAAASAAEMSRRAAALAPLERAGRRAIVAACNDALEAVDAGGQPRTER